MRLANKTCLITGAGSGIGRATAVLFGGEGARVAVADIDRAGAEETARTIDPSGTKARVFDLDVTDQSSVERCVKAVTSWAGPIDVLFNNAGIAGIGKLHETSNEVWDRVMDVNVRGIFLMSRAVLPLMLDRRSGSIINMSSCIAEIGLRDRASYGASKGAVLALTRCMQADYAKDGIRVNALLPGTIHTPFVDRYLRESYADPEEGLRQIRQRQLTGELGSAQDVAYAALYLASDESKFVMGSGLAVDGGVTGAR